VRGTRCKESKFTPNFTGNRVLIQRHFFLNNLFKRGHVMYYAVVSSPPCMTVLCCHLAIVIVTNKEYPQCS
jgi:hypothetical protein